MGIDTLNKEAKEHGTYIVELKFRDETNTLVVPNTLSWTLTDEENNVINSRLDVIVDIPDSIINIVLSGNDLEPGYEILTIKGTYNSTYGLNLPLTDSVKFLVQDLVPE
jgi:hypothetical protein